METLGKWIAEGFKTLQYVHSQQNTAQPYFNWGQQGSYGSLLSNSSYDNFPRSRSTFNGHDKVPEADF